MFMSRRWQIGTIFALCTVYVAQGMELEPTVKNYLDGLADVKPRDMLAYLSEIKPQETQLAIFDKLTGCNISGLYRTVSKDILLAKIGRDLETEACGYERPYLPDERNPIMSDNTLPYDRQFDNSSPRFVLKKDTEVCVDLHTWDPDARLLYLKNVDGATIPVAQNEFDYYTSRFPHDEDSCMRGGALPGTVHILKKIGFQLAPNQNAEGYFALRDITISSYPNYLPEYTIDASIADTFKHIRIYTRTHIIPDLGFRYIRSYELQPLRTSQSFAEALCQFITFEIKKMNIKCVVQAQDSYKKRKAPDDMITTLYTLASNDLSYRQNEELHSLLASSEEFGKEQAIPERYLPKTRFWPLKAQKVAYTWGFRAKGKVRSKSDESPCCAIS
jgi:hypothetical protein